MSLACKLWDLIVMGGLEQTSLANEIFLFIADIKAHWKVILTFCLKNWMQKNKDKWPPNHLSWKRWAHSLIETIHIMLGCVVHLHGHHNKVMPLMKPFIFTDLNNGVKFRNCICWLTNDTWSHSLLCWVSNLHISNEDLILSGHVEIDL
jgi:hypothetical protein